MPNKTFRGKCCNPYQKSSHSGVMDVIKVTTKIRDQIVLLGLPTTKSELVCNSCRKQLMHASPNVLSSSGSDDNENRCNVDDERPATPQIEGADARISLNESLLSMQVSPVQQSQLRSTISKKRKFATVATALASNVFQIEPEEASAALAANVSHTEAEHVDAGNEMLQQFKAKLEQATTSDDKYLVLTALPNSWSIRKIQYEMNVPFNIARRSKELVRTQGILSTPMKKLASNRLDENTVRLVREFYWDDENSRACPGKRDAIRVTEDGQNIQKQRRLLMCNLEEAFALFTKKYPELKIGFSKFAEVRPKEVVLALDKHGTHSVCVCVYHQNVQLIFEPTRRMKIFNDNIGTVEDLLNSMVCPNATSACHFNKCAECPGVDEMRNEWAESFSAQNVDEVKIRQWISSASSK